MKTTLLCLMLLCGVVLGQNTPTTAPVKPTTVPATQPREPLDLDGLRKVLADAPRDILPEKLNGEIPVEKIYDCLMWVKEQASGPMQLTIECRGTFGIADAFRVLGDSKATIDALNRTNMPVDIYCDARAGKAYKALFDRTKPGDKLVIRGDAQCDFRAVQAVPGEPTAYSLYISFRNRVEIIGPKP